MVVWKCCPLQCLLVILCYESAQLCSIAVLEISTVILGPSRGLAGGRCVLGELLWRKERLREGGHCPCPSLSLKIRTFLDMSCRYNAWGVDAICYRGGRMRHTARS